MKSVSALAVSVSLALLLAACATTPPPERKSPREINHKYVNSVNHQARRLGTEVIWINPPTRPTREVRDQDG